MSGFVRVSTGGSHRDMGVDFGRAAREVIRAIAAESRAHFRQWTGRDIASAKRYAAKHFLPALARRYPAYLEEVRGIAEGAGISFDDLFYLTADEELVELWNKKPEKCSSAAIRTKEGMLLGHNEDYPPRYMDRMVIVDARPDDGPAFLALTYPYIIAGPSCGLNAAGLAFAANSLTFRPRSKGVPTNYILRDLFSSRRLADVPRVMRVPSAIMGNAVVAVSAKERTAIAVEASPRDLGVLRMGAHDLLAHTNHVRSESFDRRDERPTFGSRKRCAALEHLLFEAGSRDRKGLQAALSSEKYGLLRHGRRANDSCTVASAVLDPGRGIMYVAKRGPKGHGFKAYGLTKG